MPYQIRPLSNSANRALRRIHPVDQRRIIGAIEALAKDPRPSGAVQLRPALYRIRVGSYRVVYRINDDERWIELGRVESRGETTYRAWDVFRPKNAQSNLAQKGPHEPIQL